MTLIEAIKSGKRFRRTGRDWQNADSAYYVTSEALLADDWEVEEPTVTITEAQLAEAYFKCISVYMGGSFDSFKKALGFK